MEGNAISYTLVFWLDITPFFFTTHLKGTLHHKENNATARFTRPIYIPYAQAE